ncbi:MAG: winged helix-turn-helix domain-containing protein [Actinomycetota bacterium]|nr:winged helix-turn-helix domain-containing protein [Actinomycetota bacterium]
MGQPPVKEIYEREVEDQHFSEEQQAVPTRDGRMSEIEYRLHWARTHLKAIGAIENSARGVWAITEKGRSMTPDRMHAETRPGVRRLATDEPRR